jgi:hypothetical protein
MRKNKKFIDPRYFMDEKTELNENIHAEQSPIPGRSDPRFGRMTIVFDSDVDKGLYIVYNAMKKSKREPEFLQWLSSLGYTQDEMMQQGEAIKDDLKNQVAQHPDFPGWGQWSTMTGELQIPTTAAPPIGAGV